MSTLETLIHEANQKVRQREWGEAALRWEEILAAGKNCASPKTLKEVKAWGHNHIGMCRFAQGRFAEALFHLQTADSLNFFVDSALLQNLSKVLAIRGLVSEADQISKRALARTPRDRFAQDVQQATSFLLSSDIRQTGSDFTETATEISWDTPIFDVGEHTGLFQAVLDLNMFDVISPGDWDRVGMLFDDFDIAIAVRECLIDHTKKWEETTFFRTCASRIDQGEMLWNCDTVDSFLSRLNADIGDLFHQIQRKGVVTQLDLHNWNPVDDIRIAVGRKGKLIFMNGQHRLAIARALKLEKIPVRIVLRHTDWYDLRSKFFDFAQQDPTGAIYQQLPHCDLLSVPAHHSLERLNIIRSLVGTELAQCTKILDIGAHWGAISITFSSLGFRPKAVEYNSDFAPYLQLMHSIYPEKFDYWIGDVFDLSDIETYDGWIALNIFHHFLRKKESFERFRALLRRSKVRALLFQSHNRFGIDPMADSYTNFSPEEFVAFLGEELKLPIQRWVWTQDDGRPVYLLTAH